MLTMTALTTSIHRCSTTVVEDDVVNVSIYRAKDRLFSCNPVSWDVMLIST